MHSFREFVAEGGYHLPVVSISKEKVDLAKPSTVNEINRILAAELARHWMTPYGGWKRVCKVLEMYAIEIPKVVFKDTDIGEEIVVISQFGHKWGANLDGTVTQPNDQNEPEDYLYFSYEIDETGFYDCKALVTDEDGLNDILGDSDEDIDTGEIPPEGQLKVED
jgi:hypothetical protein